MDGTRSVAHQGYITRNPVNGELIREWACLDERQLNESVDAADRAFSSWSRVTLERRADALSKMALLLEKNGDAIARQVSTEMGKLFSHAQAEVVYASAMFRYYAEKGAGLLADEEVSVPGAGKAVVRREPVGVVLGIEPFNAPIYQSMRVAAPNLMLGNTVLIKPSDTTAGSTLMLDDLFIEAGFPEGAYQTLLASVPQLSNVIADNRVRAVAFTGSTRAGSQVGSAAGKAIKPVVLELGGSDAFLVLDSADLDKAVATAVACRLTLNGQACAIPKRVIVTDAVADEFIARFATAFRDQKVGDPFDPETTVGPLSSERAASLLQEQYEDAIEKGATVLVAGGREGQSAFFKPAVLTDVRPGMRLYEEEAFGPLGMIFRVSNVDEAVALANDTIYGLSGAVFAEDLGEAQRVSKLLDTGSVGINAFVGAPIEIPFGGTKSSGVGRELGRSGMEQFSNIKTYVYA